MSNYEIVFFKFFEPFMILIAIHRRWLKKIEAIHRLVAGTNPSLWEQSDSFFET